MIKQLFHNRVLNKPAGKTFRFLCFLCCILVLVLMAGPFCVSAETTVAQETTQTTAEQSEPPDDKKTFVITERADQGVILQEPETAMFWEYPLLQAGQTRRGTFTLINKGSRDVAVSLKNVDLPYGDEEALAYLSSLHLTVWKIGGETLYSGKYVDVAGSNGLKIQVDPFRTGEQAEYGVELRCGFDYKGNPGQVTSRVSWEFQASATVVSEPERAGFLSSFSSKILVISVGALFFVGVILIVVQVIRRHKKKV